MQDDFRERLSRIENLVTVIEQSSDTTVRNAAQELVQSILDLHGNGIERMLEMVADANTAGQQLIDSMGDDELVGSLMMLHGLHPLDLSERVSNAIDSVRPYLASHGGDVELLDITPDGTVRLRLIGNCDGCPSSSLTLKHSVEQAITKAAPDVIRIVVDGLQEQADNIPAGFVSMEQIAMPE